MQFALMHHHEFSLSELENMIPWVRQVYITLLKTHLEVQEQQRQNM